MSIRVVVCGDDGVGKSSLITALVKDRFYPCIEDVLPPLTIPRNDMRMLVVDTSPQLSKRDLLSREIRQANVVWLVYSDHYTFERIALFWLPYLRSIGVNVPVILTQNKLDIQVVASEDEDIVPLMHEFKEIDLFVRCSARDKVNVNEAFYFCQRAFTHPIAPLYDAKEGRLKRDAIRAFSRIFTLSDRDQTGFMSDIELLELQYSVFGSSLDAEEVEEVHSCLIDRQQADSSIYLVPGRGITREGFLCLMRIYAEQGRHETIWGILRHFHYTNSLSLDEKFLHPKLEVPPLARVELSPDGYRFFADLFTLFDKDNDGGLNDHELAELFGPTPGVPKLWLETGFPDSTVVNDNGYVTLQGWLAQWAMTALLAPRDTLAYLAMLGFETRYGKQKISSAIRVTKAARPRNLRSKIWRNAAITDRNVFNVFVLGGPCAGKSEILASFLQRPGLPPGSAEGAYMPTLSVQVGVNSLEMPGGKQCYLVLQELGELETPVLENPLALASCDALCLAYDSADPDSFAYVLHLLQRHPSLDEMPIVFAALKADLDRVQQRTDEQPDEFAARLALPPPLHVSAAWQTSLSALQQQLVEAAQHPGRYTANSLGQLDEDDSLMEKGLAAGTAVLAAIAAWSLYRRLSSTSS